MPSVVSNKTPTGPLIEKDGTATFALIKWMQNVGTTVNGAFDSQGNYQGPIGSNATINGRSTLASIVENIGTNGVVNPVGLPSATSSQQGAVIMPAGATNNQLGTAATLPRTDFDPAGAATAAQTNAEAHADTVAATAQSNAEAFASDASNLSSGTVPTTLLAGISVTITTFGPTTNGSMTFTNGLLTSQLQAT